MGGKKITTESDDFTKIKKKTQVFLYKFEKKTTSVSYTQCNVFLFILAMVKLLLKICCFYSTNHICINLINEFM